MKVFYAISLIASFILLSGMKPHPKVDYTGRWILNMEKSRLQSEKNRRLTGALFVINQQGDEFSLTRYHIYGEKKKKMSFSMTADGKAHKVKFILNGKLEWMSDSLEAKIWNKGFTNTVHYRFGESPDEFIADETFLSAKINYHNYWVFDREIKK